MKLKLLKYFLLSLVLLGTSCEVEAQFTSVASASAMMKGPALNPETFVVGDNVTADGKFLAVFDGDSRVKDNNNSGGAGPDATGKGFEYVVPTDQVNGLTNVDVWNVATGMGSAMPQYCISYHTLFPSYYPVVLPLGSSGANVGYDGDTNNFTASQGINRATMTSAVTAALTKLGLKRPYVIEFKCSVNDIRAAEATESTAAAKYAINDFCSWVTTTYPKTIIKICLEGVFGSPTSLANHNRRVAINNAWLQATQSYDNLHITFQMGAMTDIGIGADGLHQSQTGENYEGDCRARWFTNSTYDKWTRSLVSSMPVEISTAYKNKISGFVTAMGVSDLLRLENLHIGCAVNSANNVYVDLAFRNSITKTGGGWTDGVCFTTSSTSAYWSAGFKHSIDLQNVDPDNFIQFAWVKTNRKSAGTVAYLFGAIQSGVSCYSLQQAASNIARRANDATLRANATYTKYQDDHFHGTARNGGTTYEVDNGTLIDGFSQALLSGCDRFQRWGVLDNGGTLQQAIDADYIAVGLVPYDATLYSKLVTALRANFP